MAKRCSQLDGVKLELPWNLLEFILKIHWLHGRKKINTDVKYCYKFYVTNFINYMRCLTSFTVKFSENISSEMKYLFQFDDRTWRNCLLNTYQLMPENPCVWMVFRFCYFSLLRLWQSAGSVSILGSANTYLLFRIYSEVLEYRCVVPSSPPHELFLHEP